MNEIEVSIVIATFNSAKILPGVLEAIKNQDFPSEKMEILIVDGGSTDSTFELAKEYNCVILNNPKTEPVNAKLIGIQNAKGRYVVSIDHDEVMENRSSISLKVNFLKTHPECKCALSSGYKRPPQYPLLNQYISEFGDPFSLYMYDFSKDYHFFEKVLKRSYDTVEENDTYTVVSFGEKMRRQPIIELCCAGTMVDKEYFSKFENAFTEGSVFVHLFYMMIEDGIHQIGIFKNDPLLHFSVDSLKAYFPKLKWRICNNVHFAEKGEFGFSGRSRFQPMAKYKKMLFPLYSYTLVLPTLKGIFMGIRRKNPIYLIHPMLCVYVTSQIIFQYSLKVLGITPSFKSYDGKKKISR